jgi:hypothetical protein
LPRGDTLFDKQPFRLNQDNGLIERLRVGLTLEQGRTESLLSREQMALALAQATSETLLPALRAINTGSDLLDYQVDLRSRLHPLLLREMMTILETRGKELNWERLSADSYVCVIGSGVAACIDLIPGSEVLYLRYQNDVETQLRSARRKAVLPRNTRFLEAVVHERIEALLSEARKRIWFQLSF